MAQLVKNIPAMQETWVESLGWEDPLEKGKATHSSTGLENSMDCIVHGVAKSRTQVNNFHSHSLIVLFQLRAFCPLLKSGSPAICFNTFLNIIPRYGICCPQISEVSPVTTSLDNFRFNWRFQIHETETGHIQH